MHEVTVLSCNCDVGGRGARGTEAALIQHSNMVNNRHVFVFNGMLTIITNYSKTQSIQGHGVCVARCPSFAVSRLLLLLVTTVYPATLNIYPFVYSQSSKRTHALTCMDHTYSLSVDVKQIQRALQSIHGRSCRHTLVLPLE